MLLCPSRTGVARSPWLSPGLREGPAAVARVPDPNPAENERSCAAQACVRLQSRPPATAGNAEWPQTGPPEPSARAAPHSPRLARSRLAGICRPGPRCQTSLLCRAQLPLGPVPWAPLGRPGSRSRRFRVSAPCSAWSGTLVSKCGLWSVWCTRQTRNVSRSRWLWRPSSTLRFLGVASGPQNVKNYPPGLLWKKLPALP